MAYQFATELLQPLAPPVTYEEVASTVDSYNETEVKATILEISAYLIALFEVGNLFDNSRPSPYRVSVKTLSDRLHNGRLAPHPMRAYVTDKAVLKDQVERRTGKAAHLRPLEDFEDLYLVSLGQMKEIHEVLNMRLFNGFSQLEDDVTIHGPTIKRLNEKITECWDTLNYPPLVKSLDNAVRRGRIRALHDDINLKVRKNEITERDSVELLRGLYNPQKSKSVQGLVWAGEWPPPMINGFLEAKYYKIFEAEKKEAKKPKQKSCNPAKIEKKRKMSVKDKKKLDPRPVSHSRLSIKDKMDFDLEPTGYVEHQQKISDWLEEVPQDNGGPIKQDGRGGYAIDWESKMARVNNYSQHLREMASDDALYLVKEHIDATMNMGWC